MSGQLQLLIVDEESKIKCPENPSSRTSREISSDNSINIISELSGQIRSSLRIHLSGQFQSSITRKHQTSFTNPTDRQVAEPIAS